MSEDLSAREGVPRTEHPAGKPYSQGTYNKGCRCPGCKIAKANARLEKLGKPTLPLPELEVPVTLPKRPPGVVWMDPSGITTVVRCERCNKAYGPWVYDEQGARDFRDAHNEIHRLDPAFDWSAWSQERLMKNPGGRPPLEPDEVELCSVEGCSSMRHAKGLCHTHYTASYRASKKAALEAATAAHNARAEAEVKAALEARS